MTEPVGRMVLFGDVGYVSLVSFSFFLGKYIWGEEQKQRGSTENINNKTKRHRANIKGKVTNNLAW